MNRDALRRANRPTPVPESCAHPVKVSGFGTTRSAESVRKDLLRGVERTYSGRHETGAIDPKPTFRSKSLILTGFFRRIVSRGLLVDVPVMCVGDTPSPTRFHKHHCDEVSVIGIRLTIGS
jgi:hypothetical protein